MLAPMKPPCLRVIICPFTAQILTGDNLSPLGLRLAKNSLHPLRTGISDFACVGRFLLSHTCHPLSLASLPRSMVIQYFLSPSPCQALPFASQKRSCFSTSFILAFHPAPARPQHPPSTLFARTQFPLVLGSHQPSTSISPQPPPSLNAPPGRRQ